MRTAVRALTATLFLALSACSVAEDSSIPCYDNAGCPQDYPRCDGASAGSPGKCRALQPGETVPSASVKFSGVQGTTSAATVRGKVKVDVVASSRSGVKAVTLKVQNGTATFPQVAANPPLYTFQVDTASAQGPTGALKLVAQLDPADGSASVTDTLSLNYDNTPAALTARVSVVTAGDTVALTPVFGGGIGTINGITVTSGAQFIVQPEGPASTYQLRVTNAEGDVDVSAAPVTVNVVAAPVIASFAPVVANLTTGSAAKLLAVFSGGSATIDNGVGTVTSNAAVNTAALTGSKVFTLTVTNAAGTSVHATAPVSVFPAPGAHLALTGAAVVTGGTAVSFMPTCSDSTQTGAIDHGVGAISSGAPVLVQPPLGQTLYTLTCTNPAGATDTSSIALTAVLPPRINAFGPAVANITTGSAAALVADFANGAGNVDGNVGAVVSGTPASTGSLSATRTFTLTVTNAAGQSVQATTTVNVFSAPVATLTFAGPATITTGTTVTLTPACADNTQSGALNQGIGSIASNTPVPVTPAQGSTTYALTCTNGAGATATASQTLTAVAAPTITSFSASLTQITTGKTVSLTPVFANGTATISGIAGQISSGTPVSTPVLTASQVYTLTVTNAAGASATKTLAITVSNAPVASLTLAGGATAATITDGSSVSLVPVCGANQTGNISPAVGAIASNTPVPVTPPADAATTYTLTCTNAAGDSLTSAVTVTAVAAPSIAGFTTSVATVTNGGAVTLTPLFANGTAAIAGLTGAITSGAGIQVTPPSGVATTYQLTVTNAAGASVSRSVTVTAVAAPVANLTVSGGATSATVTDGASVTLVPVCAANQTGSINQGVGAIASNTPVPVSPPAGVVTTYKLTCTNAAGDAQSSTVSITAVAAPTGTLAAASTAIDNGTATTLTATFANGNAAISPSVGAFNTGVPVSTGTLGADTTYQLTVTNAAGASVTSSVTVHTFAAASASLTLQGGGTVANITTPASVTLVPVCGAGQSGFIDSGVGNVASGTAVPVAPTSTTTYKLTCTNGANHTASSQVTVNVANPPVIGSFSAPATIDGTVANITFNFGFGGGTASIDHGVGNVTGSSKTIPAPAATTTYTLTVTNATGGTTSATATVVVVANATASLTASAGASPLTITAGTSTNLVPVCGANQSGSIDNGVGAVASNTPVPVAPGAASTTYTLTCTNAANSSATATFTVKTTAAPAIGSYSAAQTSVTAGNSTVLSFNFSNGTGDINGTAVASPGTLTVTPSGPSQQYKLTVTNGATPSASTSQTITVSVIAAPTANLSASTTSIAAGQSVQLTPTFTNGSGAIDNGVGTVTTGNAVTVSPSTTTTYTLTVTNSIGGTATSPVTVTVGSAPVISTFTANGANPLTIDANTANVTLAWSVSNATSLSIDNGVGTVTGTSKQIAAPTSTKTYKLTATGPNNSTSSQTVTVNVVPVPSAADALSASATDITLGDSVTLTPSFASGETATLALPQGPIALTSGTGVTVTPGATGTASYTMTVKNAAGSTLTRTATVNVWAAPQITQFTGPAAINSGGSVALTYAFANGTGAITGAGTQAGIAAGNSTATFTAPTAAGNATYQLSVTNSAGKQASASVTVSVVADPTAALNFDNATGPATRTVDSGTAVVLYPAFTGGTGTINGTAVTTGTTLTVSNVTAPTTYTLTVVNSVGIKKTASVTVTLNPKVASFTASNVTAGNGKIDPTGTIVYLQQAKAGTSTFQLTGVFSGAGATGADAQPVTCAPSCGSSVNVTSGSAATITPPTAAGAYTYTLTVTNSATATATKTVTLNVLAAPTTAALAGATTITTGTSTNLTPTVPAGTTGVVSDGTNTYAAQNGVAIPVSPTAAATTYTLTVTDLAGNTQSASTVVNTVAAPVVKQFFANTNHATAGDSVTFTLQTTGTSGDATVAASGTNCGTASTTITGSNGTGSLTMANASTAAATCTFTVTVQNAATTPAAVKATETVTVELAPVITAFNAAAVTTRPPMTVTATYKCNAQGGTANVNGVAATCDNSSRSLTFNNVEATTAYVLSVTNPASKTITSSSTATADAVVNSFTAGTAATASSSAPVVTASTGGYWLFANFAGSGATGFDAATLSCSIGGSSCNNTLAATTIASGGSVGLSNLLAGTYTYTLAVTANGGANATATVTLKAVAAPTATLSGAATIDAGNSTTLTANPTWGGTGSAVITNSLDTSRIVLASQGSQQVTVSPAQTATYTLTATNEAGSVQTSSVTVTVNPAATISDFQVNGPAGSSGSQVNIVAGQSVNFLAVFANGTAVISNNVDATTLTPSSGTATAPVSPTQTTTYTLTVTGANAQTVSRSLRVVLDPSIASFTVDHANVTVGTAVNLTGTFSNGTGSIDNGVGAVTSGSAAQFTPSSAGSTTLTLTVQPVAPSTLVATRQVTITAVAAPSITSFNASPALVAVGGASTLSWTFSNGVGSIDHGLQSGIAAGSGSKAAPTGAAGATTYTLTVAPSGGAFGAPASLSATVTVAPGSWAAAVTKAGFSDTQRSGATVTAIPGTNKILVAGGYDGSGAPLSTAMVCDTTNNTCHAPVGHGSTASTMVAPRAYHQAVYAGGWVLLSGGFRGVGVNPAGSFDAYDPVNDGFVQSGMPSGLSTARAAHQMVVMGSTLYVIGGVNATGVNLASVEAYDATGTPYTKLSAPGSMANPRSSFTATVLQSGTSLIACGGVAQCEIFNGASWTTTGAALLPEALSNASAVRLTGGANQGSIVVSGGANAGISRAHSYLLTAAGALASTTLPDLSVARSSHAGIESPATPGKVLLCGGYDASGVASASCDVIDASIASPVLLPTQSMLSTRVRFQLAVVGTNVFAAGGLTDSSPNPPNNTVDIYTP